MSGSQNKPWTKKEMPSLSGKLAIVTGAAGGLGYEIALGLAEAGAEVILVDKNEEGGKSALEKLRALIQNSRVTFESVDLGNLDNVSQFCTRFNAHNKALDILVNNAGVLVSARTPNRQTTINGFEAHFGINYLAHFALVAQLLPSLRRSAEGRVVNVGSLSYRFVEINFEDLQMENDYSGMRAYAQSKLANLLFTLELQRRSDEGNWGLRVATAHPGFALTDIARSTSTPEKWYRKLFIRLFASYLVQDAATGALNALFAASDSEVKPGEYYGPSRWLETCGPVAVAHRQPNATNSAVALKLWEVSVNLTSVQWPE